MYTVYLAVAAVLACAVDVLVWGAPVSRSLLQWLLVIHVGLGGVWAFMGHYFASDKVAVYIGWPAGSPFQKEIAFANLGLGACGLLCFFFRDGFWLATMVFATVFLFGAFSVHVDDRRRRGNRRPGNAGPVFFADLCVPLALWVLYFI
jgi:hypothetical protein